MDAVRIRVDPPDTFIAAGNYSRGLFLCSEPIEVVLSAYILRPGGGTGFNPFWGKV